jgi:hypothetical protein
MMFWSDRKIEWTAEHERTLRALTVGEHDPGTIVHDFKALLSFVRGRDLPVTKTYRLPQRKVLPEINARLAHPLQIGLKSPQLKSYPHIRGLYLLLRATGLGTIDMRPSKPVLAIDEALYASWSTLSPPEQYFTLLEAWLLRARPEIVGEWGRFGFIGDHFASCMWLILGIPPKGMPIAGNDDAEGYMLYRPGRTSIALMELFGLLSIEHGQPVAGEGWQVVRIYRTPLGEAVFALLYDQLFSDFGKVNALEEGTPSSFGLLQPIFVPYLPQWQRCLALPARTFREGCYVFKVSLGRGLWRRIALDGRDLLDVLASAILDAYEFDHDHLYQFSYRNRFGVGERVQHPFLEEKPSTDEIRIGDVPLAVGQSMTYLFDFGDGWEFNVTLEQVDPARTPPDEPFIMEARGEPPEQYPIWDEEEW